MSTRPIEGRRSGAVIIVDATQRLIGIFTDSDLARLFEGRQENALDRPIGEVMTRQPILVPTGSMLCDAMAIMAERKLSELPVVDSDGKPRGLLDITDLVNEQTVASAAKTGGSAPSAVRGPRLMQQNKDCETASKSTQTPNKRLFG